MIAPRTIAPRTIAPLTVVALACAAGSAGAQRVATTVDVGGASVRYADAPAQTAMLLSPAVRVGWERAALAASGTASQLGAGDWSAQARLDGSVFTQPLGAFLGELGATLGASAHRDGTRTGQTLAVARAHLLFRDAGVWLGAGGGRTRSAEAWGVVRVAEIGAWAQRGPASAALSAVPTAVDGGVRYTDATLAVRADVARAELAASVGVRAGGRGLSGVPGASARTWSGATATIWVTRWMGVTASGGTYPLDPTQGFPGGRYAQVGLRLGSHRASAVAADERPNPVANEWSVVAPPTSGVLAFRTEPAADGRRTLRVHAPSATSVDLMGDFTRWRPVRLARGAGGWWSVDAPVGRGTHQLNIRVDGGAWLPPPGLAEVRDEFGGSVGLLVIE